MLRNTILLLLLVTISLISLVFALIMLYSSPDNTVHTKEAGYFIFAGSLGVGAILYNTNLNIESDYIIKIIYVISSIICIMSFVTMGMILQYASPSGTPDEVASAISFFGALIVLVSAIVTFKKSKVANYE